MAAYGSDIEFQAWLDSNGYVLPADAPTLAVLRQRGSTYIDAVYGPRFVGQPVTWDQELAWPRVNAVTTYGQVIPSDVIPRQVVNASYRAAVAEALEPGVLSFATSGSGAVKREKVEGVVDVEYFENTSETIAGRGPLFLDIEGLLSPFLEDESAISGPFIMAVG